jgi:MFS family permease
MMMMTMMMKMMMIMMMMVSGQGLVMAVMNFVAAIGALFSGALGDILGRKGAFAVAALLTIVGAWCTPSDWVPRILYAYKIRVLRVAM